MEMSIHGMCIGACPGIEPGTLASQARIVPLDEEYAMASRQVSTHFRPARVFVLQLVGEWMEMLIHDMWGLVRESNPGPLAPQASIIPLDEEYTMPQ